MFKQSALAILTAVFLSGTAASAAPRSNHFSNYGFRPVQSHAGQMDTDGILSPGERPNPNIDYDKAQRRLEHHGDYRVDNPENDSAARADRHHSWNDRDHGDRDRFERDRDEREHQEWEEHRREEQEHHDYERRSHHDDDYDEDRRNNNWRW